MNLKIFNNFKNINFLKHKKKYFIVFAIIFAALISVIVVNFSVNSPPDEEDQTRTTIEIPFSDNLDENDIQTIEDISSDILEVKCNVQKPQPVEEINAQQKNKIIISFFNEDVEDSSNLKEKIKSLATSLSEEFREEIKIKNIEEILVSNHKNAYLESFMKLENLAILGIFLILILIYFAIAFKKLSGLVVALSMFLTFVFEAALIMALFSVLIGFFNFALDKNLFNIITIMLITTMIYTIVNANLLFSKIKNISNLKNKKDRDELLNVTLNLNSKHIINNLLILTILPFLAGMILCILNLIFSSLAGSFLNFIPFLIIYLILGIFCYMLSLFFIIPSWAALKK